VFLALHEHEMRSKACIKLGANAFAPNIITFVQQSIYQLGGQMPLPPTSLHLRSKAYISLRQIPLPPTSLHLRSKAYISLRSSISQTHHQLIPVMNCLVRSSAGCSKTASVVPSSTMLPSSINTTFEATSLAKLI